jgi:hypothetical protein
MSTPSETESAGARPPREKQATEDSSITWKREYKGHTITIFGSQRFGWNAQIDKREPLILGYTRARAIKYSKGLIDEEQAKWHTRSAGGTAQNPNPASKAARLKRSNNSFRGGISADRRRG